MGLIPVDPDAFQLAQQMVGMTAIKRIESEWFALRDVITKPPVLKKSEERLAQVVQLAENIFVPEFRRRKCSLLYVVCALDDPNGNVQLIQELLNADQNMQLIATTPLTGLHFLRDKQALFDLLKTLFIDGPAWPFVKKHDTAPNGRASIVPLCIHCEGHASILLHKQQAYKRITDSHFGGEKTKFSITADFVTVPQDCAPSTGGNPEAWPRPDDAHHA